MALASVVLPAPLGPNRTTISPSATYSETPCRIRSLPYPEAKSETSSNVMTLADVHLYDAFIACYRLRRPVTNDSTRGQHVDVVG